jgi:hypothetical protein
MSAGGQQDIDQVALAAQPGQMALGSAHDASGLCALGSLSVVTQELDISHLVRSAHVEERVVAALVDPRLDRHRELPVPTGQDRGAGA